MVAVIGNNLYACSIFLNEIICNSFTPWKQKTICNLVGQFLTGFYSIKIYPFYLKRNSWSFFRLNFIFFSPFFFSLSKFLWKCFRYFFVAMKIFRTSCAMPKTLTRFKVAVAAIAYKLPVTFSRNINRHSKLKLHDVSACTSDGHLSQNKTIT